MVIAVLKENTWWGKSGVAKLTRTLKEGAGVKTESKEVVVV
jgi:hypothetical protein